MPATFEREFRVRNYECDAFGNLQPVNYVRYMQEVAIDASADVGWHRDRYQAAGYGWLARETHITFLHPVSLNEQIIIKTWVADFRRVRSWRQYDFRRVNDGQLIARASTEWIYVHIPTGKPASVPQTMIADFHPDGAPLEAIPRDKFPETLPAPPDVFTLAKRIPWGDIDTEKHLNNAAYIAYLQDASTQVCRHYGWSLSRLLNANCLLVPRELRILYLLPGFMDDILHIRTYGSPFEWASSQRYYDVTRPADNAILARAHIRWLCVDTTTRQLHDFPPGFVQAMQPNLYS